MRFVFIHAEGVVVTFGIIWSFHKALWKFLFPISKCHICAACNMSIHHCSEIKVGRDICICQKDVFLFLFFRKSRIFASAPARPTYGLEELYAFGGKIFRPPFYEPDPRNGRFPDGRSETDSYCLQRLPHWRYRWSPYWTGVKSMRR